MNSKINYFNSLIISLLLLISMTLFPFETLGSNWQEVTPSKYGRQWFDVNSVKSVDDNIIVISRFKPRDNIQEITYKMLVNCETQKFKDIKTNSETALFPEWKDSNGDSLIDQVIYQSCKTIKIK